jgi:hypothetical protein
MSQPRRRRRRRKRGSSPEQGARQQPNERTTSQGQPSSPDQRERARRSRRRRRGRSGGDRSKSPLLSEDLVRALPKERPETLTAPPDGSVLEDVIGELQSVWGVPQYPQEYRITLKVAEERESRVEQPAAEVSSEAPPAPGDGPKREKAPAAPMLRRPGEQPAREKAPGRKRRRRRRGRGSGGGAPGA